MNNTKNKCEKTEEYIVCKYSLQYNNYGYIYIIDVISAIFGKETSHTGSHISSSLLTLTLSSP